jgi:hypothetical protein
LTQAGSQNRRETHSQGYLPFWQSAQRPFQIDNFADNRRHRLVDTGMPRHYKGKKLNDQ